MRGGELSVVHPSTGRGHPVGGTSELSRGSEKRGLGEGEARGSGKGPKAGLKYGPSDQCRRNTTPFPSPLAPPLSPLLSPFASALHSPLPLPSGPSSPVPVLFSSSSTPRPRLPLPGQLFGDILMKGCK